LATGISGYLKWLNIAAFVLTVVVNSLAGSTTMIGGVNTAQVSDSNPTLVTPAGYVFAIWGIIYVLLAVFVITQAMPQEKDKEYHKKIGWFFVLSCLINIVWLFMWQYGQMVISVVLMLCLLLSLMMIYLRLDIGKSNAPRREKLTVQLPFSVYFGWISIATIANISAMLVSLDWDGFGIAQATWAVLIVAIAVILTLLMTVMRKDVAFGLVVIWALLGISVKQSTHSDIATAAQIGAIIVLIALAAAILLPKFMKKATEPQKAG